MRRGGILPCFKHFPGHGSTSTDSHEALPIVDTDERTLRERDLMPFATVAGDAPAMMSAHVCIRAFDAERPATLSRRVLETILREELGFRGAFVTDCLEMGAVGTSRSPENAVQALAAGADLLLFSHDPDLAQTAVRAIESAVSDGRLAFERLGEAHARVLSLRESGAEPLPLDAFAPHPGVGREIARRAVTLVRGVPHADPTACVAVAFGDADAPLAQESPALVTIAGALDPTTQETDAILAQLVALARRPILLARRAHLHPAQAAAIVRIVERYPNALVVSLLEPFDLPLFAAARHLLAAYGDDVVAIGGLADVIFGGSMPSGTLPVQ
jgi:beta-N-acetylhexosaminidase